MSFSEADRKALSQMTMGTPAYQLSAEFTPDFSVFNDLTNNGQQGNEIARLIAKHDAVRGMDAQQLAASGFTPWSNEDSVRLAMLSNTLPDTVRRSMNDLKNRQIEAGAWALQDDPNASGFDKQFGSALLGNKTFANVVGADPTATFSLPMGDQLGNMFGAWGHRGVDPGDLMDYANARDYLYDWMRDNEHGGAEWKSDGLGYNTMGIGGNDFGPVVGDDPGGSMLWGRGVSSNPYIWGQPENSPAPPPNPFQNYVGGTMGGDKGVKNYNPVQGYPDGIGPAGPLESWGPGGPGGLDERYPKSWGAGGYPQTSPAYDRGFNGDPSVLQDLNRRSDLYGNNQDIPQEVYNGAELGTAMGGWSKPIAKPVAGSNVVPVLNDTFETGGGNWGSPNMVSSPGAYGTYGTGWGVVMPSNPIGSTIVNGLYGMLGGL